MSIWLRLRTVLYRPIPSWAFPALLCGWAVIGALHVKASMDGHIADRAPSIDVVAGPGRTNANGGIRVVETPAFGIDRELPTGTGSSIGTLPESDTWVDPLSAGLPWTANGAVEGLLTFRGNPTRTFHGLGPIPKAPKVLWRQNLGCSNSPVGSAPKQWCGTGWTGQPTVFRAPTAQADGGAEGGGDGNDNDNDNDGKQDWWVGIGGYNRAVNFFDPLNGREVYPRFETGDIIKGSITVDPDGYPLVYTGSRDNFFHIAAIDGPEPRELWRLSADDPNPTLWNNDWDSSALIIDDHLFVGGENSRFYIVKLNRGFDGQGSVTVDPEIVFSTEGWDDELLAAVGDQQVSIENSVAISGNVVYFANSGGLVQGWDIGGLTEGREPERIFRYWTGDDTDASIVIDDEGMLYVGSQFERGNARARELGQVFKLDPSRPDDPLVWSHEASSGLGSGVWATPALYRNLVIVPTDDGRVLGLDRFTGQLRWTIELPGPLWSSPVIVQGVLIQGDCAGSLHAFDLANPDAKPPELWSVQLDGCIESTPAVWDGRIYVGTRSGQFVAVGDQ